MLVEYVLMKKKVDAKALPKMATLRHPNLFARALTIGPEIGVIKKT